MLGGGIFARLTLPFRALWTSDLPRLHSNIDAGSTKLHTELIMAAIQQLGSNLPSATFVLMNTLFATLLTRPAVSMYA